MLHGHTKIDQVPVSDTGTGKTRPENVPIGYQRDFFFFNSGYGRTRSQRAAFIPDTGEGKRREDIQPLLLCSLSSPSCKAIPP